MVSYVGAILNRRSPDSKHPILRMHRNAFHESSDTRTCIELWAPLALGLLHKCAPSGRQVGVRRCLASVQHHADGADQHAPLKDVTFRLNSIASHLGVWLARGHARRCGGSRAPVAGAAATARSAATLLEFPIAFLRVWPCACACPWTSRPLWPWSSMSLWAWRHPCLRLAVAMAVAVPVLVASHSYRADWEPEAACGKCMAGVPVAFWRSPVVLWGPSTDNFQP